MGPAAADMSDAGGSRKRKASMDTAAGDREPLQQLQQQEFLAAAAKATTSDPAAAPLNAFELQRQQRIEHNRQRMQELGVGQAAAAVKQSMQSNGNKRRRTASKKKKEAAAAGGEDGAAAAAEPSRRSSRLAAQPVITAEQANAVVDAEDKNPDHASLWTQEQYFKLTGQEVPADALVSDGKFKGWVHPDVCTQYGIEGSAAAAWEANGGGKFTRKPDMSSVPAHLRVKGWSEAKAFAATMLRKNPNTYFYRHVAPHETQAQGEWTEEEHQLFLQTARQHGVGDKWGLFATYIPQRVGYQCSAYYRDVVVAQGLVLDKRFRMTMGGKAVFVGEKQQ